MSPTQHHPFSSTNDLANRLLLPLLRSGAGRRLGQQLALVQYRGRRSGLAHELVTQYVMDGPNVRISVGGSEHKTWWRNFETVHAMRLRLAGQDYAAVAHIERDGDRLSVLAELTTPYAATAATPRDAGLRHRSS